MHPSRDQSQPPGWSDQLKRAFHLRDPWSRSKKVLLGSILSSLLAVAASLADFGALFEMWKNRGVPRELHSEGLQYEEDGPTHKDSQTPEETPKVTSDLDLKHKDSRNPDLAPKLSPDKPEISERPDESRLYQDDPVYKGFKDPPSTLNSLDLKHRDSRPCLDLVLRFRDSKESRDREIAHSCIERVIQNERPTASDELLSQLYTLRGDLLIRDGESAKAILDLETASRLSPGSVETAILLLRAYKAEGHKLRTPPPWSEDLQRRIHELDGKIDTLEGKLQGNELRGRSAGVFIGIEKFSGFNLADISAAVNDATPDSTSQLAPIPLTSYWKDPPCQASSVPAFASGTCGLGGNGQVVATSRTALDTGYWVFTNTDGIGSNLVSSSSRWVRVAPYDHIAARGLYNFADLDSQEHATYTRWRIDGKIEVNTRLNGAIIAATGRDLELSVGSVRAEQSQVTGSVKIDTRLNGALLTVAGTTETGSTGNHILSFDSITAPNAPEPVTPSITSGYISYPIEYHNSFENLTHIAEAFVYTAECQPNAVALFGAACIPMINETADTTVEPNDTGNYFSFDRWADGSISASSAYTSNTPSIRLEQNNSGGFTAQTWYIAGNEANFFVQDVTGGSRLPLRIRPGASTSSIDISAAGDIRIGTASPSVQLQDHNPVEKVLAVGVNGAGAASLAPLQHAAEDAQSVSAALRDLGFRSTVLVNEAATQPK